MRSELTECVPSDWHDGDLAFEAWRAIVVVAGRNNEIAKGDEGVARQRPRTAMALSAEPIGGDASFEERRVASERKFERSGGGAKRPAMGCCSDQPEQKKGPIPRRLVAGTGP